MNLLDSDLPQCILQHYGLIVRKLTLLQAVRHVTYHVETIDDQQFNLRICPAAPNTEQLLSDELLWLDHVSSQTNLQVPTPIRNYAGDFVTVTLSGSYYACVFRWIEGQSVTDVFTPQQLFNLGRTIAMLHACVRTFPSRADQSFRADFYYDARLIEEHRTWLAVPHPTRTLAQSTLVDAAIAYVLNAFADLGNDIAHFGIIHADIHVGNVLQKGTDIAIIDFEQLGWGYYGYDLAVLYTELAHMASNNLHNWDMVLAGYQAIAPLPFPNQAIFDAFRSAVYLSFLDWVYNTQHPIVWHEQSPQLPGVYATLESILST